MSEKLTMSMQKIKENDSNYCWVNIELGKTRIGKARIKKRNSQIIIKNINIFPEFEKHGFGRQTIDLFKKISKEIIAEKVRATARGFWEQMEFTDTGNGNYRWRS